MSEALLTLAVLACPVGMGLMMWFMMRGNKNNSPSAPPSVNAAELTKLRAEVDQLRAEHRDPDQPNSGQNSPTLPLNNTGSR